MTIFRLLSEIKEGLKQVKRIQEGKIIPKNIKNVLNGK